MTSNQDVCDIFEYIQKIGTSRLIEQIKRGFSADANISGLGISKDEIDTQFSSIHNLMKLNPKKS